jgi:hypothetical protein
LIGSDEAVLVSPTYVAQVPFPDGAFVDESLGEALVSLVAPLLSAIVRQMQGCFSVLALHLPGVREESYRPACQKGLDRAKRSLSSL